MKDRWIWIRDTNTVETPDGDPVAFIPDAWPKNEQHWLGSLISRTPELLALLEAMTSYSPDTCAASVLEDLQDQTRAILDSLEGENR